MLLYLALSCLSVACAQTWAESFALYPDLTQAANLLDNAGEDIPVLTGRTLFAPDNNAVQGFLLTSSVGTSVAESQGATNAVISYHFSNASLGDLSTWAPDSYSWSSCLTSAQYTNVTTGALGLIDTTNQTSFMAVLTSLDQPSKITAGPWNIRGGEVYAIDQVLTPPVNITTTAIALGLTSAVGVLLALNMAQELTYEDDRTLFLPSNNAFERVSGSLSKLSTAQLTSVMRYHVLDGIYYGHVPNGNVVQTEEGHTINVTEVNGIVYANTAPVIKGNVLTSNGFIHVIDKVLNPNGTEFELSSSTDLPFTSIATSTGTARATPSSVSTAGDARSSSVNVGAISGGVVGGVLALAAIVLFMWYWRKHRKSRDSHVFRSELDMNEPKASHHKSELQGSTAVGKTQEFSKAELGTSQREIFELDDSTNLQAGPRPGLRCSVND